MFLVVGPSPIAIRVVEALRKERQVVALINVTEHDVVHTVLHTKDLVVINCAEDSDMLSQQMIAHSKINATWPGVLATACRAAGTYLIHVSTGLVFGGGKPGPYSDFQRPFPLQHYGRLRLHGEWGCRLTDRYTIVRLPVLYGPEYPDCPPMLARKSGAEVFSVRGEKIAGTTWVSLSDENADTPVYVEHAAWAIAETALAAQTGGAPRVVHVSSGEDPITWLDLLAPRFTYVKAATRHWGLAMPSVGGLKPTTITSSFVASLTKTPSYAASLDHFYAIVGYAEEGL